MEGDIKMTLAQEYLTSLGHMRYKDPEVMWTDNFIKRRLLLPLPGAEGMTAERYVFDETAPERLGEWCESGMVDWETAVKSVQQPDLPMWIEYPLMWGPDRKNPGRMGFMYGRVIDEQQSVIAKPTFVVAFVGSDGENIGPQGLITLPDFPITQNEGAVLIWFQDQTDVKKLTTEQLKMARDMFGDFLACLFLLQTPKIVETKLSSFGPRKLKVQEQTGKPFVELHRVAIRIGMAEPRYKSVGGRSLSGSGATKKYHRVIPHFRTYNKDTATPKVRLVESFWRGDRTKGIVLHERPVKLGKDFTRREE